MNRNNLKTQIGFRKRIKKLVGTEYMIHKKESFFINVIFWAYEFSFPSWSSVIFSVATFIQLSRPHRHLFI